MLNGGPILTSAAEEVGRGERDVGEGLEQPVVHDVGAYSHRYRQHRESVPEQKGHVDPYHHLWE